MYLNTRNLHALKVRGQTKQHHMPTVNFCAAEILATQSNATIANVTLLSQRTVAPVALLHHSQFLMFVVFAFVASASVSCDPPALDTGGHSGAVPAKFCCAHKKFVLTYNKNRSPLKMYFSPQTLRPGYGPAHQHQAVRSYLLDRTPPFSCYSNHPPACFLAQDHALH